jgi:hypothetical protein
MPKSHNQLIAETYKKAIADSNKLGLRLSDNISNVIVWIVGFSIGGLALILTNPDKLTFLNKAGEQKVILFLAASVISGVIGRVIYLLSEYKAIRLNLLLDIFLAKFEHPYQPRKLRGDELAWEILYNYKEDFPDRSAEEYLLFEEFAKNNEHEKAREFYIETVNWSGAEYEIAINNVTNIINDVYGYKKKPNTSLTSSDGIWMRRLMRCSFVLYVLSLLLFALTFTLLSFYFLNR